MNIILFGTQNSDSVIKDTIKVLRSGGLVVFPSDTVYGLLVDATNEKAVEKLIQFKNRQPGKAISIFVPNFEIMQKYVEIPENHTSVMKQLLPGPFTFVLPSQHKAVLCLESEKGTLGVRIPDYEPVTKLVALFGKPLTATSANLGGRHPHYSIESLLHELPQSKKAYIDLIIDAGKLPRRRPSTVIDLSNPSMQILRKGDIVFTSSDEYRSESRTQTQEIGRHLMSRLMKKKSKRPIVIVMKGDLGSGKTEMTRGIASYFKIEDIISPTFVVYYEYDIAPAVPDVGRFIHVDLYNIQDEEEFEHLGILNYLDKPVVMVIEWGEKLGSLYDSFRKKAEVVFVELNYQNESERIIEVKR